MIFALQSGYNARETLKIVENATRFGYDWKFYKDPPIKDKNVVPVGSIEWCENVLGFTVKPDFYPKALAQYMHRNFGFDTPSNFPVFCKSSEKHKDFESKIIQNVNEWLEIPQQKVWSEIVHFENEWRLYIANGKILDIGWYDGYGNDEAVIPSDIFEYDFANLYGAADFGVFSNGQLALVEFQPGYACGWYGDNHEAYMIWLINCWTNLLTILQ